MNTPTPLTIRETTNDTDFYCEIESGKDIICAVYDAPDAPERAAEIVRAVNYHDRLVDMVQKLSDELGYSLSNSASVMGVKFTPTDNSLINSAQQLLTEIEKSNDK